VPNSAVQEHTVNQFTTFSADSDTHNHLPMFPNGIYIQFVSDSSFCDYSHF